MEAWISGRAPCAGSDALDAAPPTRTGDEPLRVRDRRSHFDAPAFRASLCARFAGPPARRSATSKRESRPPGRRGRSTADCVARTEMTFRQRPTRGKSRQRFRPSGPVRATGFPRADCILARSPRGSNERPQIRLQSCSSSEAARRATCGRSPDASRQGAGRVRLQVFGPKTGVFRDSSQHPRPDLFALVKREDHIWPALAPEGAVRAGLPSELPPDSVESCQNAVRPGGWPTAHAAGTTKRMGWGRASPCSICSARTRRASTSALAMASFAEEP